ncbi:GNAT family N-acetyltransferase [Nakamurella antarctica]|uniref:GNAT family N-acetyltransferase n=1 Tax=Nakamurella antarctica TaxID=1902245 RepID=A0A3G8ZMR0_9ACTN|nr:GNAT family N-acetyltransferase [Nakamurella antarctica]AZI58632.1 GNAT family N-acetyltransferase [Nakamurella antarctica]
MKTRRATAGDVDALVEFPDDPGVVSLSRKQVRDDFEAGRMRPEWSWVIEDEGRLLGRALWWGRGESSPSTLDALDLLPEVGDPRSAAVGLLRAGHADLESSGHCGVPPYTVRLRGGWRDDPQSVRAADWRIAAMADVGIVGSIERRQYAWTPDNGVPASSTRVTFRHGSDDEFIQLFGAAARGTLDVETLQALESMDEVTQAKDDFEFYESCPGDRQWWQVATAGDGTPVGFIVPSATPYNRNVGYLGVLPGYRGKGLVDDLLGEVTRMHAAAGADRITATTDMTNLPMAAAFHRANYQVVEVRLVLKAPR